MPPAVIVAGIGVAISAVGTFKQIKAQKKSARLEQARFTAETNARNKQFALAEQQQASARLKANRELIRRRQSVVAQEAVSGFTSTGATGARQGLVASLSSDFGVASQARTASAGINASLEEASVAQSGIFSAQAQAATGAQIAGVGSSIFSAGGGSEALRTVFKT